MIVMMMVVVVMVMMARMIMCLARFMCESNARHESKTS